jgi:cytochrome c
MRPWLIAAVPFVALVGLGQVHPFGNPRAEPTKGLSTLLSGSSMPANARQVLVAKCADCHSSETRWPPYARIAPGSWLIERDIIEARKHMDLSRWEQLPEDGQDVLMAKIVREARSGDIPPLQYLALHWGARVSKSDLDILSMLDKNAVEHATTLAGNGDPVRGKLLFEKRCTGCHALEADREGPRLAGVFGRKAGSVPGYTYSTGLKNLRVTWSDGTLEKWLSDPDLMVPDNQMSFSISKAQERKDLIAYLKTTKN